MTSDYDFLRRLAPPVEPASDAARARVRARVRRERPQRRRLLRIAAPMGVAAVAALVALLAIDRGGGTGRAYAAAAVRAAETSPRLLVDDPDWKVERADEWQAGAGEMTVGNGTDQVAIRWMDGADYQGLVTSRTDKSVRQEQIKVLGDEALLAINDDPPAVWAVWLRDGTTIEVAGRGDVDTFRHVLDRLKAVDVDTWLGAMPADVVAPDGDHASAVDDMLRGVPLPPGFDADALRSSDLVRDRYQLGAQVISAVTCGWLDSYFAAKGSGDKAGMADAAAQLATSRQWPILQEMQADGGFSGVVWAYADAVQPGANSLLEKKAPVAEVYRQAFECP